MQLLKRALINYDYKKCTYKFRFLFVRVIHYVNNAFTLMDLLSFIINYFWKNSTSILQYVWQKKNRKYTNLPTLSLSLSLSLSLRKTKLALAIEPIFTPLSKKTHPQTRWKMPKLYALSRDGAVLIECRTNVSRNKCSNEFPFQRTRYSRWVENQYDIFVKVMQDRKAWFRLFNYYIRFSSF